MNKKKRNVKIGYYKVKVMLGEVSARNDTFYVLESFPAEIVINSWVYPIAYC